MKLAVLVLAVTGLDGQIVGGWQGQARPMPPPARQQQQVPFARSRGFRGGGGFYGGGYSTQVIVEQEAPPVKEDKLKELIISPVYRAEKITPKLIEIP